MKIKIVKKLKAKMNRYLGRDGRRQRARPQTFRRLLSGKNGTWLLADRENGNSEWRVLLLVCRNHCFIVEHML